MKLKLFSWNVRGVNNPVKRNVIRNFIRSQRVDLVCMQETKIQEMSSACARSFGVGRFSEWKVVEVETCLFFVTCMFKNVEDGFQWAFTGVYGSVERSKREMFWEELGSLRGLWEGPWCIGRDFNMVLSPNERNLVTRLSHSMRRFAEVINELGLKYIPLQGCPLTWRGGHNNHSMSRLDRFLVTVDWESQFSNVVQSTLSIPVSDHCPVMLDSEGIKSRPSPFRFENMWLKFEGFKDLLRVWWQSLHFSRSFSFILASKLKALKGILRVWNKEVFGRVEIKKEALSRVYFWDDLEKELSLEEAEEREKARDDYKKWVEIEEVSWR